MNKKEYFTAIKEIVADNTDLVAFIDAEIAKLDNRAAKGKAKRAEKTANDAEFITREAYAVLEDAGRPITLAELVAGIGEGYTPNKVVYHIRPLVEDGTIVKEKAKVGDRKIMTYRLG